MSYDVTIGVDVDVGGPTPLRAYALAHWNYTSNMAPAWRAAGADLATFDRRPAGECADILAAAIATMEREPERFAKFDAPNGWGSMATLLPRLRVLLAAMRAAPKATVWVCR